MRRTRTLKGNKHKVYELIRADVGGEMFSKGWMTKAETSRFTRTADSVGGAGDEARHAVERTQPPPKPMLLQRLNSLFESCCGLGYARRGNKAGLLVSCALKQPPFRLARPRPKWVRRYDHLGLRLQLVRGIEAAWVELW